jgi:hypothetical protein
MYLRNTLLLTLWSSFPEIVAISRRMLFLSSSWVWGLQSKNYRCLIRSQLWQLCGPSCRCFPKMGLLTYSTKSFSWWSFKSKTNLVQFLFCKHSSFPVCVAVYQRSRCCQFIHQVVYNLSTRNWLFWKLAPKFSATFSSRLMFEIHLH